jgi:ATP-dependent RNA helicase RhlE
VSLEQLKLPKQMYAAMADYGFVEPKEVQVKCLSRINGGQDMVVIGPDGIGKSTLLVMSVLAKLKYAFEVAPRALIMVPSKDDGLLLETYFRELGAGMDLRVSGMYTNMDIEDQRELLREGTDIVIGTPDRILALYIRSGINLTKLKLFIVDDADMIIRQNQQVIIKNITDNLNKCQFILTAPENSAKLEKLGSYFLINPFTIEM